MKTMKKLKILLILTTAILYSGLLSAQVLSESAKRKVTVGVDVFTDILMYNNDPLYMPADFRFRTINQGVDVFAMYNFQLGQSLSSFAIGLGIRNHNLYSANSMINDIKADTIVYTTIDQDFKRTKINLTYLELPAEFKYRTKGGFKLGIGLKVGYKIASKQKYVGNRPADGIKVNQKSSKIYQLEDWTFGPTLRIGYKFISVYGYYQVTKFFKKTRGPEIAPLSLGITITPF
jgi:hypothetical protein